MEFRLSKRDEMLAEAGWDEEGHIFSNRYKRMLRNTLCLHKNG